MTHRLVLRTSNKDGKAHGGFQWPASGMVECPDWKSNQKCGNGLHGILWPEGDWSDIKEYDEELWQVVKVLECDLVKLDGKVKFPRGEVVYSGNLAAAFTMVAKSFVECIPAMLKEAQESDTPDTVSSGHYAKLAASGHYATIDATGKDAVIACAVTPKKFKAANGACISAPWNDGTRTRFTVGYVGENIEADVWYSVSDSGKFVKVEK